MSTFLLEERVKIIFILKIFRSKVEDKLSGYIIQAKCN
jgi:hypothetical protein